MPNARTVITGVTIVDTHDGSLTHGQSIVLEGGTIAAIAPASEVTAGGAERTFDARGMFAVPGYLDLHAHPLNSADPTGSLTLMLANGITGFRQMSGTPETLAARRAGTLLPPIPAPELLEMSGAILTGANAGTPELAVAEIQRQHGQGADFIKVIDVRPDVFFAGLAEATRLGLRYIGHLPPAVDVAAAARAGMRSIEHLGPRDSVLLGCSSAEPELRAAVAQQPPKTPPISGAVPIAVIQRALANPAMFTDPAEFLRYDRVVETFSPAKLRELAAVFVAAGTWHVPTLIRIRTQMHGDDEAYRTDPDLRYVPPAQRRMWDELSRQFTTKLSAAQRASLDRLFALQRAIVKPLKDAGVKLMAGSDSGGSATWNIPGFSLHHEFDLLAQAGLSALEILQMATLNGAEFLGRTACMGSVAAGAAADLVLLAADPTADVRHLHAIAAVVRAGTVYPAAALQTMKDDVERRLATFTPDTDLGPSCC